MAFIPIIYLFLCYLVATAVGGTRKIRFWGGFLSCLFFTPIIGLVILLSIPKRKKTYCIRAYKDFNIGCAYYYRMAMDKSGTRIVVVYHATASKMSLTTFNSHFALIEEDDNHLVQFLKLS